MATRFSMTRDINSYNGFGRKPSDLQYGVNLATSTEQHITLPANPDGTYRNWLIIFSPASGSNVWVSLNATAVLPTGTLAAVNCENNPTAWEVPGDGEQTLSFITANTSASIGFVLYAVS